jgi:hypothetical protein
MNQIPSMMEYILSQQGRSEPSEEELALLAASRGEQPMQLAANAPEDKRTILQRLFGRGQPAPPPQQPGERKADELVAPGSLGDQLRQRRLEQERMLREQAGLQPEDMLLAQAPDPYGGVSVQTRAAMDRLGKDVGGDMSDLVVGAGQKAPTGTPAVQSVRGRQTPKQEEQLIKMLMDRGMSEKEARSRAKSVL